MNDDEWEELLIMIWKRQPNDRYDLKDKEFHEMMHPPPLPPPPHLSLSVGLERIDLLSLNLGCESASTYFSNPWSISL